MKAKRPGLGSTLRRGLESPRLTAFLLVAVAGFSLAGRWVSARIAAAERPDLSFSPQSLFVFDALGLRDVSRSAWFIFAGLLLGVNLALQGLRWIGPAWRRAFGPMPAYPPGHEARWPLTVRELECEVDRGKFVELATAAIGAAGLAPRVVTAPEGGELQLAGQRGHRSDLARWAAILAALAGAALTVAGASLGFKGRLTVDEGGRAGFFQLTRGKARGLAELRAQGQAMPGFYELGFEVGCRKVAASFVDAAGRARGGWGEVAFGSDGAARRVSALRPAWHGGLSFHAAGFSRARSVGVRIEARDRGTEGAPVRALLAPPEERQMLPGASFRVVRLRETDEDVGASVELEYAEGEGEPERFWIFQKFPAYDGVHRKRSRYVFSLVAVEPRFAATLGVSRDPLLLPALVCFLVAAAGLAYSLRVAHARVWLVWAPGVVALAGWSNRPEWTASSFDALETDLRRRLGAAPKAKGGGGGVG
jgi:hypothetical protein